MNPHALAEEVVQLSSEYSTMSEELAAILQRKAVAWAEFRAKCTSDTQAERAWEATVDGLREMGLRLIMKASEKRQSAIKTMLRVLENESRNQM